MMLEKGQQIEEILEKEDSQMYGKYEEIKEENDKDL